MFDIRSCVFTRLPGAKCCSLTRGSQRLSKEYPNRHQHAWIGNSQAWLPGDRMRSAGQSERSEYFPRDG